MNQYYESEQERLQFELFAALDAAETEEEMDRLGAAYEMQLHAANEFANTNLNFRDRTGMILRPDDVVNIVAGHNSIRNRYGTIEAIGFTGGRKNCRNAKGRYFGQAVVRLQTGRMVRVPTKGLVRCFDGVELAEQTRVPGHGWA